MDVETALRRVAKGRQRVTWKTTEFQNGHLCKTVMKAPKIQNFNKLLISISCFFFRFIKLGHQPFDAVAMWGFNAPEWMFSTFAAMMAGGMAGGLYPTDTPETAAFKVAHSGATWLCVSFIIFYILLWECETHECRMLKCDDAVTRSSHKRWI